MSISPAVARILMKGAAFPDLENLFLAGTAKNRGHGHCGYLGLIFVNKTLTMLAN